MGLRIDPWKAVDEAGNEIPINYAKPCRLYPTEWWRMERGWLACVTSNREIIKKVRRYYEPNGKFVESARYHDEETGWLLAVQWRVSSRHKRTVERLFGAEKR